MKSLVKSSRLCQTFITVKLHRKLNPSHQIQAILSLRNYHHAFWTEIQVSKNSVQQVQVLFILIYYKLLLDSSHSLALHFFLIFTLLVTVFLAVNIHPYCLNCMYNTGGTFTSCLLLSCCVFIVFLCRLAAKRISSCGTLNN